MSNSLYADSVPVMSLFLGNLKTILQKAQQHAAERKIDESVMLGLRLFPDMFALLRQVQTACDNAKGTAARLAGVEIPKHADTETTFEELYARIDKTLAFINGIDPKAFEGRDNAEIVLAFGTTFRREFTAAQYLRTWALPNFDFHAPTAYNILRANGVAIGKMDFLG